MNQDILFISDLHLSLGKPAITRRFLNFLATRARSAQALYILGDLFDAWIGDDDNTPPNPAIRSAIQSVIGQGTPIFLQVGNRDFLLGPHFAAQTGIALLPDLAVIDLLGTPTLLMHGDLLCTDDVAYQRFRSLSRTAEWRQNVLGKPLWLRHLAARGYRLRSVWHKRKKSPDIMDVNPDTVITTMRAHNCLRLIHGHTHRPARHTFTIDQQAAERFVLADWNNHAGEVLCWRTAGWHREVV